MDTVNKSCITPLEAQLNSYSATAETSAPTPPEWTRKWSAYAAAAGAALALGTSVSASIIYSEVQNIILTTAGTAQQSININGSVFKLMLRHDGFTNAASLGGPAIHASANYVGNLASGAVISTGIGFLSNAHILHGQIFLAGTQGNFPTGNTGFAAIKAGSDLGWIRLRVDGTSGNPSSVTAIDWAYNDVAGQSIQAGDTGSAVPEPGTMAMELLAAGAAGILAWRRRRANSSL